MSNVGIVVHTFNLSRWEAKVGRSVCLRLAQSIEQVEGQPALQRIPVWKKTVCVCMCVCFVCVFMYLGEDTVCVHVSIDACGVQRLQYSELNLVFCKSTTICSQSPLYVSRS